MFKLMNWKHWLLCQASALMAGYLAWSASGNPWIGGGVVIGTVVVYTFMLAGRGAKPSPGGRGRGRSASSAPQPVTRQQRRAEARAQRKRQSD